MAGASVLGASSEAVQVKQSHLMRMHQEALDGTKLSPKFVCSAMSSRAPIRFSRWWGQVLTECPTQVRLPVARSKE